MKDYDACSNVYDKARLLDIVTDLLCREQDTQVFNSSRTSDALTKSSTSLLTLEDEALLTPLKVTAQSLFVFAVQTCQAAPLGTGGPFEMDYDGATLVP